MVYAVFCFYEKSGEFDFEIAKDKNIAIQIGNRYVNQLITEGFRPDEEWDKEAFFSGNKTFKVFIGPNGGVVDVYFREKEIISVK